MNVQERKVRLENEIEFSKQMILRNACEFRPTSYLIPSKDKVTNIAADLLGGSIGNLSSYLSVLSSLSGRANNSGWFAMIRKIILSYFKLRSTK